VSDAIHDSSRTIAAFLDAAAAKQPTPGGGSVAALVGALSASMGEMAINYSTGKKDLAAHEAELQAALGEFRRARQVMQALMVEDQAAYEALTAARKARREDASRSDVFDVALLASIRVPQAIGATAVAIIELCERLAPKVNRFLASDLAVCVELAMAAARCSVYNVRANLPDVVEQKERDHFEQITIRLISHATTTLQQAMPKIWARQGGA
jgi:methenyltetrahydrofolate cyclohydrolase